MAEKSRATLREQRSRETRQKIYNVAMQLFESNGFDSVKVTDICNAADVSVGSFYHYYPSKEHILLACSSALDEYFRGIASTVSESTASASLRKLVHSKLGFYSHLGIEICRKIIIASVNFNEGSSLDIERSTYQYFEHIIEDGIAKSEFRSDLDPKQITSTLRYQLGGLVLRWCFENAAFDLFLEADIMLSSFLRLIVAHRS